MANVAIVAGGLVVAGATGGAALGGAFLLVTKGLTLTHVVMASAMGAVTVPATAGQYAYNNYPEVKQAVDSYFG